MGDTDNATARVTLAHDAFDAPRISRLSAAQAILPDTPFYCAALAHDGLAVALRDERTLLGSDVGFMKILFHDA
jgi:hypothetical protein